MLKKISYLLIAPVLLFSCGGGEAADGVTDADSTLQEVVENVEDETDKTPKPPKSPRLQATGIADGVQVDVDFGSPYVKGRTIWGDLVPYGKIWRAGANDATAITFAANVKVNGANVAAGTYALFVTPKENADWTITLNEEWSKEIHGVWGAYDHKPEKDVLNFDVTPIFTENNVESLTFAVTETGVSFAWEKAIFDFTVAAQ
ncbi:MAG: DUF2911 domain-containing protein [Crocinitomix sp.]|nr:DUF2911 domain-containing protein [Crocinitomix sp.]